MFVNIQTFQVMFKEYLRHTAEKEYFKDSMKLQISFKN